MGSRQRLIAFAVLGVLGSNLQASAQTVRGTVSGAEVAGTMITAVAADTSGVVRALAAVSDEGVFSLSLPATGPWRVWLDALGFEQRSIQVLLGAGQVVDVEMSLVPAPLPLEAVVATGEGQCGSESRSPDVVGLWQLARRMLLHREADGSSRTAHVTMERISELRPIFADATDSIGRYIPEELAEDRLREILQVDSVTTPTSTPFLTLAAEELDTAGYIVPMFPGLADVYEFDYHLPVPQVMLADIFARSHCFSVREKEGWIGLGFEPNRSSRLEYDVEGTLWLPRGGDGVPFIDFDYTSYPDEADLWAETEKHRSEVFRVLRGNRLGGHLDLAFIPDWGWVVYEVLLRTPRPIRLSGAILVSEARARLRAGDDLGRVFGDRSLPRPIKYFRSYWYLRVREQRIRILHIVIDAPASG